MASWIALLEVSLTGATKYYSSVAVSGTSAHYEPYILSWSGLTRAVPIRPGMPTSSTLTVQLSNADLLFSQLLESYTWRGRTATLKIGLEDTALSGFGTHFTGKINDAKIEGSICTITIRDASWDKWQQPIPGKILASKFPNLPDNLLTTQANIVFGRVSSAGKTDLGLIKCPLVDTVDHLYLVACHRMKSIDEVYVPAAFASATYEVVTDDDGWTYLKFDQDVEDPEVTDEYSVSCDACGLEDVGDGSGTLLTVPAQALREYLIRFAGNVSGDIDSTSYNALVSTQGTYGLPCSGVICQEGWKHAQVIEQFLIGHNTQIFGSAAGKIKFSDYKVETAVGGEDEYSDSDNDILKDSLAIYMNQDIINSETVHYDFDSTQDKFLQDPKPLENETSITNLGVTNEEDLPLYLVDGAKAAKKAASLRIYYSDEDRYFVRFKISAPQAGANLDLCSNLLLTHYAGLGLQRQTCPPTTASGYGFYQELLRVVQLDYELNGTPMINITCLSMDPGENAYDFETLPANVVWGTTSESSVGAITVTWTLAGGGDDPAWVSVYYKRSTDKLSQRRFGTRVAAATLTASFTPAYDSSATLDIYLIPEDAAGVIRELAWEIDTAKDTTLAEAIDLTEPAWDVASIADIAVGDYILCGAEINRVESKAGVTLTLYSSGGIRVNYEDTVAATHANGAAVGTIKPTVTYGTHSSRTSITAVSDAAGTVTGLKISLNWSDLADPSDDLTMFSRWEVWGGTSVSFNSSALIDGYVYESSYDHYAITSAGPFYYWITSVTGAGVRSTESNRVGPCVVAHALSFVSCYSSGDTFIADIGLPDNVPIDDIDYFEQVYTDTEWESVAGHPVADDPNSGSSPFLLHVPVGTRQHLWGTDASKTYWFAWRAHFRADSAKGRSAFAGAWKYLMNGANYLSVTSGTSDGGAGEWDNNGAGSWAYKLYSYTSTGGETYIQLPALANLSFPLMVYWAAYGGSMAYIRKTTQYTVSNVSGYTRITILNADLSTYTHVAGDIADVFYIPHGYVSA